MAKGIKLAQMIGSMILVQYYKSDCRAVRAVMEKICVAIFDLQHSPELPNWADGPCF